MRLADRRRTPLIIGVAIILMGIGGAIVGPRIGSAEEAQQLPLPPKAGGWLAKLPADQQIEAIDRQLRGFDMAMFEVNYRYTEMYFGAVVGTWGDALETGATRAWAIMNGYERRPKRRANAEEIFFKEAYPQVLDAIRKQDIAMFKERVDVLRTACNACHAAEKVPFIQVGLPAIKQAPLVHD